ncbi:MAG: phosphoribosylanthranilate isomerase [Gemmataceae bacterium]|nr:phosphoribosylanthranilate isomerase [Gemmataceae bacterium]
MAKPQALPLPVNPMGNFIPIKFCGITSVRDAECAIAVGCDAIGLNFFPSSPRYVSPAKARQILCAVPVFTPVFGVVVNPKQKDLLALMEEVPRLSGLQIHGKIPAGIQKSRFPWLATLSIDSQESKSAIKKALNDFSRLPWQPMAVLVDAKIPGLHGGTGVTAPWELLSGLAFPLPLVLAGGLNPQNVALAIQKVYPNGLDVASGIEESPGKKCPQKMRDFVNNARGAIP